MIDFFSKWQPKAVPTKDAHEMLRDRLNCLKSEKPCGWQELAVKLIRQSRLDDPELEMKRLESLGVVTPDIKDKVTWAIRVPFDGLDPKRVMLCHALEIQNIYRETHHVFVHAQSSQWLVFPHLVKEFMKRHYPGKDVHQFKFLRLPNLSRDWDISKYSNAEIVEDSGAIAHEDLISCDGYFYNIREGGSAIYFMSRNGNVILPRSNIFQKVIKFFYSQMNASEVKNFAQRVLDLTKNDTSIAGNLFLVCIPKEKSSSIQYRAHAFGSPCTCHPKGDPHKILEGLQMSQLNDDTSCRYFSELYGRFCFGESPQFRLFTPELKKENGVKIYLIPSDKSYSKELKLRVRHLIQEIDENMTKASMALKKKMVIISGGFTGSPFSYAFNLYFGGKGTNGLSHGSAINLIIQGNAPYGIGETIPIEIGRIETLSEESFGKVFATINQVTLPDTYPSGLPRKNHDGTHSARQARMLQILFDKIGKGPGKHQIDALNPEEKNHLILAAFLLRSGRIDESSHKNSDPDDYNTRSAMIYEAYANQLNASTELISWISMIIRNSCQPTGVRNPEIDSTPKYKFAWDCLTLVHNFDLIRCFGKSYMNEKIDTFIIPLLTPYVESPGKTTFELLEISKQLCNATGCRRVYDDTPGHPLLFRLCSKDGEECWKRVNRVPIDFDIIPKGP